MDTNVRQKVSIIQKLNDTNVTAVANLPEVADRFKNLYSLMNGKDIAASSVKYECEAFHFNKLLNEKPELKKCSKLSLYGCFLDMAVSGLSFDPAMKHAYVVSFNVNVGTKQNPSWEQRAMVMISGYGELQIRIQQKQIKYADNPVLVYEGDYFTTGTKNNQYYVEHQAVYPRPSENIIACYIRLERLDGSVDYKVMSIDEVLKLKAFSKQPTSLAWTSGLPGMVQAKTIKHAFRSYPKMKLGSFSGLESDTTEENTDIKIDYGIEETTAIQAPAAPSMPTATTSQTTTMLSQAATTTPLDDDEFAAKATTASEGQVFQDDNF
jgi:recombinational DNA repair protein RecT